MLCRRFLCIAALTSFAFGTSLGSLRAADRPVANLAQIKLSGSLDEAPVADDFLFGSNAENFKTKLDRIKKAKDDSNIQGLLLQIDGIQAGWGKLNELQHAIAEFRKSGKKAYAYMDSAEAKDYLVAISCDEVCLPESGSLMLVGVRAEVTFFKDLLEKKLGIKADMLQMGDYKGADEPLTRTSMSKEFRERLESVVDDFYEKGLVGAIAEARSKKKLTPDDVKKLIDAGPYTAKAAADAGLIDSVAYLNQFQNSLKTDLSADQVKVIKNYGKSKGEDLDFSNPLALLKLFKPPEIKMSRKAKIAVIYVTGVITSGKSNEGLFGEGTSGSTTLIEAIRQAEDDSSVKAIVLRVDSPGGSALASDLIWNELNRSRKPVVASMSDVAASGGYYVCMAARKVYAEPGTLTGSIGVVGGKLVLGGLFDKIGVNTDVVSRGANAGLLSNTTAFSDTERAAMKGIMQDTYNQFVEKAILGRIKAGKQFTKAEFDQFAEGRIWTGRQAQTHGLVDELGTLDDAIDGAKELADIAKDADVELQMLPKARTFLDTLFESRSDEMAPGLSAPELKMLHELPEVSHGVHALEGYLQLRNEKVWAIMPCQVDVH